MKKSKFPKSWNTCLLDDVLVSLESGSRPKGGVKGIDHGIPSIGAEHLAYNSGFNFLNVRYVPEEFASNLRKGKIEKYDILIVKDGATTGKTSFVDDDFPFATAYVNEHVFICRVSKYVDPKFVFFYLWSPEGLEKILKNFKGSAQGGINRTFSTNVEIPLPPLVEQMKISSIINSVKDSMDYIESRLEGIPTILSKFRHSVISLGISGDLTRKWREQNSTDKKQKLSVKRSQQSSINSEYKQTNKIPKTWKWEAIGNIATCNRGKFSVRPRNDPRYFNGKYPFIQIGDLPREGGYIKKHTQTLNEKGIKATKVFNKDTIAIAIVGATIGITGLLPYDLSFPDSLIGIDSGNLHTNRYIEFYLRLEKGNFRKLSYAGGGQPNIKLDNIKNYPIPIPPDDEQKKIVEIITSLLQQNEEIESNYLKAKEMLAGIRAELFKKAFEGRLTNQTETTEALTTLLANIKNERKQFEMTKSKSVMKTKTARESKKSTTSTIGELLQRKFKKKEFNFTQCISIFDNEDYDFLKSDFFELITDKKLSMNFNEKTKTFDFLFLK